MPIIAVTGQFAFLFIKLQANFHYYQSSVLGISTIDLLLNSWKSLLTFLTDKLKLLI